MVCLKTGLLTVALCAALSNSATAQRQADLGRWPSLARAVPSRQVRAVQVPDSVRQKVGYQHWKGAAIGAGVGAVLGSVLVFGVAGECADCTETSGDRARAVLLVTGASSALGFLVGLATPRYAWKPSGGVPDGH
jgi:hypothetical protein